MKALKNRKKNKKKIKAQITVFAALSITIVLALVTTCIRSVIERGVRVKADMISRLSTESVFAEYSNKLLDEFDIFMLKKSDNINQDLNIIFENNCDSMHDKKYISYKNAYFDEFSYATDNEGENIKAEIIAYMKYGYAAELVQNSLKTSQQVEKTQVLNEITESIVDCQDSAAQQDTMLLQLVKLVEGLEISDTGIAVSGGRPVASDDYFAKALITQQLSMQTAAIDNGAVYDVMSDTYGKYTNVYEILEDMYSDVEDIKNSADEMEKLNNSYSGNYSRLKDVIEQVSKKTNEAINVIDGYNDRNNDVTGKINECKNKLDSKKNIIGDDEYKSFNEDLSQMLNDSKTAKKTLCDIDSVKSGLVENRQVYSVLNTQIQKLNITINQQNCSEVLSMIDAVKANVKAVSNNKLRFDYSGIDFSKKSEGTGSVKKIYKTLTEGITGLVLDGKGISEKKVEYRDLATQLGSGGGESKCSISDKTAVNEYIFLKFNSFTDYLRDDKTIDRDTNKQLDYMIEYIIAGQNSDRDNLGKVISQLSFLREGVNLAHIITDPEKKNQAYALAMGLVGFTGNVVIIKAAQYLIMAAWAYGESLIEIKQLLNGGKTELVKNKNNWNLTLQNLLAMKFESDKKNDKGLDYEQYLRILLFMQNTRQVLYSVMGAIELRMIELGNTDFRLKDYIYSAGGTAVFKSEITNEYYTKELQISY